MRWIVMICVVRLLAAADALPVPAGDLVVDGDTGDAFWREVRWEKLGAEAGGSVAVGQRGPYVTLAVRMPEAGGRVLARSMGRNPVWEKDVLESPEVEDRVRVAVRHSAGRIDFEVNPWGAWRSESPAEILPAARVTKDGWTVEVAVALANARGPVQIDVERIRSRRAGSPELRWIWHTDGTLSTVKAGTAKLQFQPPVIGNQSPPLEVGKLARLPEWESGWNGVAEFELPRNEPEPRASRYPAKVKWAHDGKKLALLFRVEEPEPVVARSGGRDSNVTADDHVAVYLATSGSQFLEIAVNAVGALRDARGRGPHIMRPDSSWTAKIKTQTDIRHGYWLARLEIPLDECAAALGEKGIPQEWRIVVTRYRAARPGEAAESSALPAIGAATTFYGPARYQRMLLREGTVAAPQTLKEPAGELAKLETRVWSQLERRRQNVRSMVSRDLDRRVEQAVLEERRAWDAVRSKEQWEQFRDQRIAGLKKAMGAFPPERPPLQTLVSAHRQGRGYRLENLAFQSRQGYWVTANLYLPSEVKRPAPAIIIVHSQHFPKTQGELHDMGELWARTGCVVLVMERPGYGERVETTPWYRQSYASRYTFTKQLFLVGENYSAWAAWDIIRSVDYLWERTDVDRQRIVLLGAVAGGGEPAAVAAALDERIAAVAPFNYDQGHVRVHGDSPGQIAGQFSPWLVAASIAPRRFIRAFEFGWEGAEEPDYPNLWVDGMERSQKVWGFYGARGNLASSRGYGLIRLSMERASHCFSIGPQQREELYPTLQRWFGIPLPEAADRNILPDSQLSVSPEREQARKEEAKRRRPLAELLSLPPEAASQISRKQLHQIAGEMADAYLRTARERRPDLRRELAPLLGDIEPVQNPTAQKLWSRSLAIADVDAWQVAVEERIAVPLLHLRPKTELRGVVVAVAQGGKDRFLKNRSEEIARLLAAGLSVVLADVRGTGETAAASDGNPNGLAQTEVDLSRNLLGSRLKDLRTVLAWVRRQNAAPIALWGESFSPPNSQNLVVDELEYEVGPELQFKADPLGAHLALLAGLYETDVRAVAGQGGLVSYRSVLDAPFTYVPLDVIVLGVLQRGDVSDIRTAIAPRSVYWNNSVDGRNLGSGPSEAAGVAAWLVTELQKRR